MYFDNNALTNMIKKLAQEKRYIPALERIKEQCQKVPCKELIDIKISASKLGGADSISFFSTYIADEPLNNVDFRFNVFKKGSRYGIKNNLDFKDFETMLSYIDDLVIYMRCIFERSPKGFLVLKDYIKSSIEIGLANSDERVKFDKFIKE